MHGLAVPENSRLFEMVKRKEVSMSAQALVYLAHGSEETEAVLLSICWFAAELGHYCKRRQRWRPDDCLLLARCKATGGCAAG